MLRATGKAPHDYVVTEKTADEWTAEAGDPLGTINLTSVKQAKGKWAMGSYDQCQDGATS